MKKLSYSEKLKDPRWQKKRLEILERDAWFCQKCLDDSETLHVHHIKYNGNPWDAENKDLITLCEECHKTITDLKNLWGYGLDDIKTVKIKGMDGFSIYAVTYEMFCSFKIRDNNGVLISEIIMDEMECSGLKRAMDSFMAFFTNKVMNG